MTKKMKLRAILSVALLTIVAGSSAVALDFGPLSLHGTASQGFMQSTDNNYIEDSKDGTFDFREYGLNAMWQTPLDSLRIGAQVFGREYGAVGNDSVYLDWAYADYRITDWLGIRAGRVKIPMGFYNETRDVDALRTEILLPQCVYTELSREIVDNCDGVALYGDIAMGPAGSLSYQIVYGTPSLDTDDGDMSRIMLSSGLPPEHYDEDPGYAGALEWDTPLAGLRLGTSYSRWEFNMESTWQIPGVPMPMDAQFNTDPIEFGTVSAEYTWKNLVLSSEANMISVNGGTTALPGTPYQTTEPYEQDYNGYYLRASYRFTEWLESATGCGRTEADGQIDDNSTDIYVSLRFDITENVILKFEEHYIDGALDIFATENPDGIEDDMTVFMAKATVYF